jgi:hypothetical protein
MKFLNYCDLWNRKAMPYTIDDAESSFNKSPLPGVKVMKSLRQVLKTTDSQAIKVELLFKTYVEFLHDSGWRWSGFGSCGTPLVLDTAPQDKECQAFAVGLMQLMIAPWPFGIGLPVAEVNMRTYIGPLLGTNKAGFVARHPKHGVLGLKPNITREGMIDDVFTTMSFYRWQNHKVIEYGAKYFDPSYGCQYTEQSEMACMKTVGYGITGSAQPTDFTRWDNDSDTDETGNFYLECEAANARRYRLKIRKASLRADSVYEGPFAVEAV